MEASRFGRPDMDAELDDSFKGGRASHSWSSCDYEGLMADGDDSPLSAHPSPASGAAGAGGGGGAGPSVGDDASPDYPDDGGELSLSRNDEHDFNTTTTMSDHCNLFVPDLMYNLDSDEGRPDMPDLPLSAFSVGTPVWVVDVSHVAMQLGDAWDHAARLVCNGQARGEVVRHASDDLLFVRFSDAATETEQCFTLPRRCLSIEPVEAYPLPDNVALLGAQSMAMGGLRPRGGRAAKGAQGERDEPTVLQQYCEKVDAGTPSRRTEAAWNMFLKKRFRDSIAELNGIYDRAKADGADESTLNEVLTWRSFAYFFNREYEKSLADALLTIENSPAWVRGYVRAARAYTSLGKVPRAIEMMSQARRLLPNSNEVTDTLAMLGYLQKIQAKVDAYGLRYYLDPSYAKRLLAVRPFARGEVLFEDDTIIVGAPSVENEGACCEVCLTPTTAEAKVTSSSSPSPATARLCSSRCEAVARNFLSVERGAGVKSCDFACQLLLNKAANSADVLSIERARLAMRLFYLAYYRHSSRTAALAGSTSQRADAEAAGGGAPSVRDVLAAIGVFPIPSLELETKTKDDVEALCTVVTSFMAPAERAVYDKDLFVLAYNYVVNYAVRIGGTDASGRPISGLVLAGLASCVERHDPNAHSASPSSPAAGVPTINCEVRLVGPGRVAVVAIEEIAAGDRLTILAPKKGRQ